MFPSWGVLSAESAATNRPPWSLLSIRIFRSQLVTCQECLELKERLVFVLATNNIEAEWIDFTRALPWWPAMRRFTHQNGGLLMSGSIFR